MITEKQKQQLIDLNDSRVNEILNVLCDDTWYIFDDKTIQFNIKDGYGYGYSNIQGWNEDCEWLRHQDCNGLAKKATHGEVEQALIKEAKRRGFKNGVKVSREWLDIDVNINNNNFQFHDYNILSLGFLDIFKDGQWAEIIDDKAEIKQEIKDLKNKLKELRKKL